jgi:alpha-tubulin suppressor-like RCC1 family protein
MNATKRLTPWLVIPALTALLALAACKAKSKAPAKPESPVQTKAWKGDPAQGADAKKADRMHVVRPRRVGSASDWRLIEADYMYSCGIRSEGSLWCWGANIAGKLGDGSVEDRSAPVKIGATADWVDVVGADFITCALRKDGETNCWGGQKGGAVVYPHEAVNKKPLAMTLRPTMLDGSSEAKGENPSGDALKLDQIVLGDVHTCGLSGGKVYCWGGIPERMGRRNPPAYEPVSETESSVIEIDSSAFPSDASVKEITAGSRHTCARTAKGRVFCWGVNEHGQVGSGSQEKLVRVPEPVAMGPPPGGDFAHVAAGTFHTCAIDKAGAPHCWGSNHSGAVGDGGSEDRRRPVAVDLTPLKGSKRFERLSGGFGKTCGISTDKLLYCWGTMSDPKVRLKEGDLYLLPQAVAAPDGSPTWSVAAVSVGTGHTCAIAADGALYCWGADDRGQCGDPPEEPEEAPAGADATDGEAEAGDAGAEAREPAPKTGGPVKKVVEPAKKAVEPAKKAGEPSKEPVKPATESGAKGATPAEKGSKPVDGP